MEPRVLQAAAEASRKGLARITLLGVGDAVHAEAKRLGLDISGVRDLIRCLLLFCSFSLLPHRMLQYI